MRKVMNWKYDSISDNHREVVEGELVRRLE